MHPIQVNKQQYSVGFISPRKAIGIYVRLGPTEIVGLTLTFRKKGIIQLTHKCRGNTNVTFNVKNLLGIRCGRKNEYKLVPGTSLPLIIFF